MTIEVAEKLYSVEEFLNLDLPDDEEYELIGGRIAARQGHTSGLHGEIVARVTTRLDIFGGSMAGVNQIGKVYSGASCTLGQPEGLNNPKPDVCFVAKGRTPDRFEGPIPVAPDLAVEVCSPSDTDERRLEKIQAYQKAGIPLIWSIHMLEQYVMVYHQNQRRQFLDVDGELTGENVLPGFIMPVAALFE